MSTPHKPTPVEKIDLPEDPRKEWSEEDIDISRLQAPIWRKLKKTKSTL